MEIPFPKAVDSWDVITGMLHYIAMAAVTNDLKLGGFKQQQKTL